MWQASWGLSTRSIGAMIMMHSDDNGLILPPRVAETQVVVIPVLKTGDDQEKILDYAYDIFKMLKKAGIRSIVDDREKNPGHKYAHWELRGIPLRLEIGVQEVTKNEVRYAKRNDNKKDSLSLEDLTTSINALLD